MLKWLLGLLLLAMEPILEFVREHTNSWIWGAVLTASLLIFRAWEKRDRRKSSQRMEAKIDAIMRKVGAECGPLNESYAVRTSLKKWYPSSWVGIPQVNRLRRVKMMSKFKSRKFILAVVSAVLIVLNDGLDLGIDSDTVLAFAGIVAVWITGESVVDAKRAGGASNESSKHTTGGGPAV